MAPVKPGSIQVAEGTILVTCQPHVAIKLCRVFGGVRRRKAGVFEMSATPGHAFELEWFRKLHPLELEPKSARPFKKLIAIEKRKLASIAALEDGAYVPRDFELAIPAREYQRFAADMLLRTRQLLLADEVGLGKTISAIASLTAPGALPAVVVTMTHLPIQWEREIARFAPNLVTHRIRTGTPYELGKKRFVEEDEDGKRRLVTTPKQPDVFLVNYHKLVGWVETLAGKVRTIVFDEAQELRHTGTNKYIAARSVAEACDMRCAMSATPVYNYGAEIYAVLDVVAPGALGAWDEFCREWCSGMPENPAHGLDRTKVCVTDPAALGTYLRETGLMLRRTRKQVGRELPDLTTIRYVVEADHNRIREATADVVELAQRVIDRIGTSLERMQDARDIDYRMRQATGIAKAPAVADLVRILVDAGERVVLYGWHHECYAIWQDAFSRENAEIPFAMYTGQEDEKAKAESVRRFVAGEVKVLIISLRAGAGLDGLQHVCRTVVVGELDWSPQVHLQCLDTATEVLTHRGFMGVDDVQNVDDVAGFDIATGQVRWLPIVSRVDRVLSDNEAMYEIDQPAMSLRVTGGHRLVYERRRGKARRWLGWEIGTAEALARRSQGYRIPVSGRMDAPGVALSDDQLRVIGWFITDGTFNRQARQLVIVQAESSKFNDDIRACLKGAGLHWTESTAMTPSNFVRRSPIVRYAIPKYGAKNRAVPGNGWATLEPYLDKALAPELMLMTERQLGVFLDAVHMGDGTKSAGASWTRRTYSITIGLRTFAERLQMLCVLRGWRCNMYQLDASSSRKSPIWRLGIKRDKTRTIAGTASDHSGLVRSNSVERERVWCVENALGTLVVRRHGKVAIVGNCTGRVHRDGQTEPVVVYFCVAEEGSDPVIADVLGLKAAQARGISDPESAGDPVLVGASVDHIRKLAADVIARHERGAKKHDHNQEESESAA